MDHTDWIEDWLLGSGARADNPGRFLLDLCERLDSGGFALTWARLDVVSLHPLISGSSFTWYPGDRSAGELPQFRGGAGFGSPFETRPTDSKDDDATERHAIDLVFGDGSRHILHLATRRPGGFGASGRARLDRLAALFALPLEIVIGRGNARALLTTYLGARSAARVLDGALARGQVQGLDAALWYSDLRGFTALSEQLPGDEVVALLDGFFERLAAPIHAFGGEILKFMGDGLLAIFSTADHHNEAAACTAAVRALRSARTAMAAFNAERQATGREPLAFGVALHVGRVMYGNIGAPNRLDFTVIGPAVNTASRVEALCRTLNQPVLATAAFAAALPEAMTPLGSHNLRGIDAPTELFTLDECAGPAGQPAATAKA